MKHLKALALPTLLVGILSQNVFALDVLEESEMASTTGQDGINVKIIPPDLTNAQVTALGVSAATITAIDTAGTIGTMRGISMTRLAIHDDDGNGAAAGAGSLGNSGALVFDGVSIIMDDTSLINIAINSIGDSNGNTAGGAPMLNIDVSLPKLAFHLNAIQVANSNAAEANRSELGVVTAGSAEVDGTTISGAVNVTTGFSVVMGASTLSIQLGGAETQGSMMRFASTITGGLVINNFALLDGGGTISGGQFGFAKLTVLDAGSTTDLNVIVGADLEDTVAAVGGEGLYITLTQFGTAAGGTDINISNLRLGSAAAPIVGDVVIEGLKVGGTRLVISGI